MKVSIIIPVYNAQDSVGKCLDSIIKQTSREWEVVAINDGSSDKSWDVLEKYAKVYPDRVRIFNQENSGVTKTRERGIQEARGTYVMFIDNDDYIEPDYVETFLREIESGNYDVVVGGYRRITDKKKILFQYCPVSRWMQYSILTPWARIIKRDVIVKNNIHFLDYKIGEDIYFNMRLFYITKNVKRINYIGYNWYYNTQSVSNTTHKGFQKVYDPRVMLDNVDEAIEHSRKRLYQLWYVKWVVWYLCFSGRGGSYEDFLEEEKKLFAWLKDHNIECRFPLFSKYVKGEPFRNKAVVVIFLMLRKLHLVKLFARVYCRGSKQDE